MDIKNYLLKRRQRKALKISDGFDYFIHLPYKCPKCIWGTDTLTEYTTHLENHLKKKLRV